MVWPSTGGVFVPTLREGAIGTVVDQGTELGVVHDLHTMEPIEALGAGRADPFDISRTTTVRGGSI